MSGEGGELDSNLGSHPKDFLTCREGLFPVGIEYYRPPMPPQSCWDADLARIRASGMRIVRTFYSWDWS